ncbi:MAG TPA: efflux RND transporter periplasmic adaptor subunit [Nevskiaceae bacterium]|nr:efflux RND transporter periplasmic adaptor subunit [Nevskiaceae bacterium]
MASAVYRRAILALFAVFAAFSPPTLAAPVTLPARAVRYRPEGHAWAQVEPLAPLVLRTSVAARVARVLVAPGQTVHAGEPLATLAGPELEGELAAARARWKAARQELASARRTLASTRRTYPGIIDRQTLDAAEASLAAAQGACATARVALQTLEAQQTLSSPASAVVATVDAAAGSQLAVGAPLVTLLPHGSLWLRVEVFGGQPLPAPATAHFVPTDGGAAIAVHLVAELPTRAPNGARVFNFAATDAVAWQAGETGELVWQGKPQSAVAVPADALVLDAGHWYVLTDVGDELAAKAVTPGPTRGADVLITHGLQAGTPVVVRQAYLLYHRNFSAQFAPAD